MKKNIQHPNFYEIEVSCATCHKKHKIGTTVQKIKIETCSNCHSFYTNSQSFVTVAGRIDKFYKRYGKSSVKKDEKSN